MAALAYTADIALLVHKARAKRQLLNICNDFATKFDVILNTCKSKCLVFKPFISRNMATDFSTNFCMYDEIGKRTANFINQWLN